MQGSPAAFASRTTFPKVSVVLGKTKMSLDAYAVANSGERRITLIFGSLYAILKSIPVTVHIAPRGRD